MPDKITNEIILRKMNCHRNQQNDEELSCPFQNSIDLSTGVLNQNQSITFNGIVFEFGLYSIINYTMKYGKKMYIKPYPRGCIHNDPLQCDYFDSINITNGKFFPNKTAIYDGIEFPDGTYSFVDYFYNVTTQNVRTQNGYISVKHFKRNQIQHYVRGCLCNRKSCIRHCEHNSNDAINEKYIINENTNVEMINENDVLNIYYIKSKICTNSFEAIDNVQIYMVSVIQNLLVFLIYEIAFLFICRKKL